MEEIELLAQLLCLLKQINAVRRQGPRSHGKERSSSLSPPELLDQLPSAESVIINERQVIYMAMDIDGTLVFFALDTSPSRSPHALRLTTTKLPPPLPPPAATHYSLGTVRLISMGVRPTTWYGSLFTFRMPGRGHL